MDTVCSQCNFTITDGTGNQNSKQASPVTCKRCGSINTVDVAADEISGQKNQAAVWTSPESLTQPEQNAELQAGAPQKTLYEIFDAYPELRNLELGKFDLAAIIFLFYNLLDGVLTYHMAKKGYMSA